jgi:hypothetical protein
MKTRAEMRQFSDIGAFPASANGATFVGELASVPRVPENSGGIEFYVCWIVLRE